MRPRYNPPSSVDLRNAGFKIAPVDTNRVAVLPTPIEIAILEHRAPAETVAA